MNQTYISNEKLRYLQLLAKKYPSIRDASTEIINLQAILNLPKGTEHFLSDVHGEFESFSHVIKNASGVIKRHIAELFSGSLRESEIKSLATLVYYPKEKLRLVKKSEKNINDWYKITMFRLVKICKRVSAKYTRSKVRKSMDTHIAYIMEELIHEDGGAQDKQPYYNQIIETIINIGRADDYIVEMCNVIQRLAIDRLHIIGDIFDRGPAAEKIIDELMLHHSFDIEWGNHDISWMGAAAGSPALILNVIRISARYANMHTIEDGYGINLIPLMTYAIEHFSNNDCAAFMPEVRGMVSEKEEQLIAQIHKAASLLQFKVEAQIIKRNPGFKMDDRLLLDKIDFKKKTINIGGTVYEMKECDFPTIDKKDPFAISEQEADIIDKLVTSFQNCPKLQAHAKLLFSKGSMYRVFNGNLLFHGCIPMNGDGSFKDVEIDGVSYKGCALLDELDTRVREGYLNHSDPAAMQKGQDLMWYLWCGPDSPLFGSNRMTTFERYFISDKETHAESKDPYYTLRNEEHICNSVLAEFGLNAETSHIINGHVPVKVSKGEKPIKAGGKLLVIDGGFAKAYQKITGIAGYTLIYNSRGLTLVSHEPFESAQKAIEEEKDIHSSQMLLEYTTNRIKVGDTDTGAVIKADIEDLMDLLNAYETGRLKEYSYGGSE